jgi:hypothetical protein
MTPNPKMHYRRTQVIALLCGSLYLLESSGIPRPERKRVLGFLRAGNFVNMTAVSKDDWDDRDGLRRQLFSWGRKDAVNEGYLAWLPHLDRGVWRLSEKGRQAMQSLGKRWGDSGLSPEEQIARIEAKFGGCLWTAKFAQKIVEVCNSRML